MKRSLKFLLVVALLLAVIIGLTAKPCLDWLLISNAARGNTSAVKFLLSVGADPNTKDVDAGNALVQAAYHGHSAIVHQLLIAGGDPNAHVSGGETALMYASRYGYVETVKTLLVAGADPNHDDGNGYTPLKSAEDHPDIVKLLRQAGAKP